MKRTNNNTNVKYIAQLGVITDTSFPKIDYKMRWGMWHYDNDSVFIPCKEENNFIVEPTYGKITGNAIFGFKQKMIGCSEVVTKEMVMCDSTGLYDINNGEMTLHFDSSNAKTPKVLSDFALLMDKEPSNPCKVGDFVWIVDNSLPPSVYFTDEELKKYYSQTKEEVVEKINTLKEESLKALRDKLRDNKGFQKTK